MTSYYLAKSERLSLLGYGSNYSMFPYVQEDLCRHRSSFDIRKQAFEISFNHLPENIALSISLINLVTLFINLDMNADLMISKGSKIRLFVHCWWS